MHPRRLSVLTEYLSYMLLAALEKKEDFVSDKDDVRISADFEDFAEKTPDLEQVIQTDLDDKRNLR